MSSIMLLVNFLAVVLFNFVGAHQCNLREVGINELKAAISERGEQHDNTVEESINQSVAQDPKLSVMELTAKFFGPSIFLNMLERNNSKMTDDQAPKDETKLLPVPRFKENTQIKNVQESFANVDKVNVTEIILIDNNRILTTAVSGDAGTAKNDIEVQKPDELRNKTNVQKLAIIPSEHAKAPINITEAERDAIKRFRALVEHSLMHDYQKVDSYLHRWLKAKNFDVKAAAQFFLEAQEWRRVHKIDGILNETIFTFSTKPYSLGGIDRAGDPFIAFSPTSFDLRRLILNGEGSKVGRYWIQIMEEASVNAFRVANLTHKDTSRGGCILDLSGFNVVQHGCISCIPIFLEWAASYEALYPDFATYLIWINVPRIFLPVFELVKPFMSSTTRAVLEVYGPDKKEWLTRLHSLIPPDQLNFRFGGTRKSW